MAGGGARFQWSWAPHGAHAGLDLVDDEDDVVSCCDVTEALEEGWGGVVVSAFGLNRFDDHGRDGVVEGLDCAFDGLETAGFFLGVCFRVGGQRLSQFRKRCTWPVESRNVELVDRLAPCCG